MAPPVYAPPPAPYNWTGFYVGGTAGGGTDHFAFPYYVGFPVAPFGGSLSGRSGINSSGPILGLEAGFNYQLPNTLPFGLGPNLVLGVEIDDSWSGVRGQTTVNGLLPVGFGGATFGTKFENFGTARGRIGYAFDRFLPYFTAGFTYGVVNTYYSAWSSAPFSLAGSSTAVRSGVVPRVGCVGIGLEYAMTDHLSVKAEYLYEFINARYAQFGSASALVSFQTRTMYHVARLGLNYKFDWFSPTAPVIAKY